VFSDSKDLDGMRKAGRLTAQTFEALDSFIKAGISTAQIDEFCEDYIVNSLKARPASKGQYDYPFSVNTSPNHVVCHGMPNPQKILKSGDILNVDITVEKDGYFGDSSKMYLVGEVSAPAKRLVNITQDCLYKAIACIKPGITLGDIGHTIQTHAEKITIVLSESIVAMVLAKPCTKIRKFSITETLAKASFLKQV